MSEKAKVTRLDSYYDSNWMQKKFELTPEGFLTGKAIVTSIGVFTYRNQDGSIRRELRLPEEVFSDASIATLKNKPMTNEHAGRVVADNAKEVSIGFSGAEVTSENSEYDWNGRSNKNAHDGIHLAIDLTITDAEAVKEVLEGKTALSCGYDCELDEAPIGAKYLGMEYDFIQRNIRYNHIAITNNARAGDSAKIRLDSADAILVDNIDENKKGGKSSMADLKKLNLDGVDYEAEARVIEKYTDLKTRVDSLDSELAKAKEQLSKLEADKDSAVDRADKADEELKKLKQDSSDPVKINSLVAEKLAVIEVAKEAGAEFKMDSDVLEIKKAVISKMAPKAVLDGKDEVYISARFDSVMEQIKEDSEKGKVQKEVFASQGAGVSHSDSAEDVEKSKRDYLARLQNKEVTK